MNERKAVLSTDSMWEVCMCVCMPVQVPVCPHVESRGRWWVTYPITLSTLFFETGTLTEPGVHYFKARLAASLSWVTLLPLPPTAEAGSLAGLLWGRRSELGSSSLGSKCSHLLNHPLCTAFCGSSLSFEFTDRINPPSSHFWIKMH